MTPRTQPPAHWQNTWPSNQPPGRRTWQAPIPPASEFDELGGGNAGCEQVEEVCTPGERAEYQRGWRIGIGTGLVGGALLGALSALSMVWLGVQAGLGVL